MFERISLVISQMGVGGAERVLSILADAWVRAGVDVQLVTFASIEQDFYDLHPQITRVGLDLSHPSGSLADALASNIRRVRALRRTLTGFCPDVVLSFAPPTNVTTLLATRGTGLPVVVSERNDPAMRRQPAAWNVLRRLLYPRAAAVAVQTESVRRWARQHLPGTCCRVIPNPVRPLPVARESRRKTGGHRIVGMGRLVAQKGFDRLLEAFAAAPAEGWRLMLIGDGPERQPLEAQARHLGIAEQVDFVGQVKDPENYLAAGDIFALSSRYEGFPNALLEAMSLGIASVSFDCPSGPADIIVHRSNGLLVPAGDTRALASALRTLMADKALREKLGRAGAISVSKRFSVPAVLARWNELLGAAAAAGGVRPEPPLPQEASENLGVKPGRQPPRARN